jgi:hypothetical protein
MWRILTHLARVRDFWEDTQRRVARYPGVHVGERSGGGYAAARRLDMHGEWFDTRGRIDLHADERRVDVPLDTHTADYRQEVPVQPWHAQRRVENVLQGKRSFSSFSPSLH